MHYLDQVLSQSAGASVVARSSPALAKAATNATRRPRRDLAVLGGGRRPAPAWWRRRAARSGRWWRRIYIRRDAGGGSPGGASTITLSSSLPSFATVRGETRPAGTRHKLSAAARRGPTSVPRCISRQTNMQNGWRDYGPFCCGHQSAAVDGVMGEVRREALGGREWGRARAMEGARGDPADGRERNAVRLTPSPAAPRARRRPTAR